MKNTLKTAWLIITALAFTAFTGDNKSFEGTITYSMEIPGIPEEYKAMMGNSEVIMYIKGDKTRTDVNNPFMNRTTIVDAKEKTTTTLIEDMNGDKYYYKEKVEEKKEDDTKVKINYKDETKTIAGYTCKKAEIVATGKDGKEMTIIVFYTEEIANKMNADKRNKGMSSLKGMPLEYEVPSERGNVKMSAKKVDKSSVPDSKFSIPEGYKEMTAEEAKEKQMKGMRGGQ